MLLVFQTPDTLLSQSVCTNISSDQNCSSSKYTCGQLTPFSPSNFYSNAPSKETHHDQSIYLKICLFLACRFFFSPCILTPLKSVPLLIRSQSCQIKDPPLWPHLTFIISLTPNIAILRVRASTYEFDGWGVGGVGEAQFSLQWWDYVHIVYMYTLLVCLHIYMCKYILYF